MFSISSLLGAEGALHFRTLNLSGWRGLALWNLAFLRRRGGDGLWNFIFSVVEWDLRFGT